MQVGSPLRRPWAAELVGILVLILAQVPFAFTSSGPLDADYGRIFLGPLYQVRAALSDGELLLWDRIRYGGTPYWGLPNTPPAYPPLLAGLVLPPILATNAMLILHLLAGAWGTRALALRLGASRAAGFVAAATFLFAPISLVYAVNQPWGTMALAYLPWTLLQVVRRARGADWRACGIAAGLLYAGCTWCGGYVVFLPGLLAVGLVALGTALRRPLVRELAETAGMLGLFVVTLVGAAAGRLLPATAWTGLTSRAEGLDLETTITDALALGDLPAWIASTGVLTVALTAIGLFAALRGRSSGVAPLMLAAAVLVAFALGWPQRLFFHRFVPGFDRIRDPRHFWAPLVVLIPVTAAVGLDALLGGALRGLAEAVRRRGRVAACAAVAAAVALLGVETRAWSKAEVRGLGSVDARVAANALHLDLARRAKVEPRFRVHDELDTRPKPKKTADLIRCALGLESVEGLLGNIMIPDYDLDLIVPSRGQGPRLWGLLNCVYVTSQEPLDDPALELIEVFPEDPDEINPGTDGPYLYRNRLALPRAYLAGHAVLLLDLSLRDRQRVLVSNAWNPRRDVLVRADLADVSAPAQDLAPFDVIVGGPAAARDASVRDAVRDSGARVLPWTPRADGADGPPIVLPPSDAPAIRALPDPAPRWRRATIELGDVPEDAWLVLAETYAIYPGWRARVDGVEAPLWIANGAATAIPVPAGAKRVELAYVPPRLVAGLAISTVTVALGAVLLLLRRGRRVQRARQAAA
jgi:hypothetical protein